MSLAIGVWMGALSSVVLDARRVRSGWPRSTWVERGHVDSLWRRGAHATGFSLMARKLDGSSVRLLTVSSAGYGMTRGTRDRIDATIREIARILDVEVPSDAAGSTH